MRESNQSTVSKQGCWQLLNSNTLTKRSEGCRFNNRQGKPSLLFTRCSSWKMSIKQDDALWAAIRLHLPDHVSGSSNQIFADPKTQDYFAKQKRKKALEVNKRGPNKKRT